MLHYQSITFPLLLFIFVSSSPPFSSRFIRDHPPPPPTIFSPLAPSNGAGAGDSLRFAALQTFLRHAPHQRVGQQMAVSSSSSSGGGSSVAVGGGTRQYSHQRDNNREMMGRGNVKLWTSSVDAPPQPKRPTWSASAAAAAAAASASASSPSPAKPFLLEPMHNHIHFLFASRSHVPKP
jgi:hypothetical protein